MNKKSINRRSFLKGASALVAAPMIIPSRLLGKDAPSNKITIAMVGAGNMGKYHLGALKALSSECEVVSVCDVNDQRRQEACEILNLPWESTTRDFLELLPRKDIDAIYIATPDHWHTPLAIAAMKAGKAVYLQKPVSVTVGEGRALSNVQKMLGNVLQVGSQQRSSRNFRLAAELVRNGYIGEVKRIEVGLEKPYNDQPAIESPQPIPDYLDYNRWLGPAPQKVYSWERVVHFRGIFDYSGGYFSDWGAHHFDIVQWALDKDDSGPVYVDGKGVFHKTGIFDVPMSFNVSFKYDNGIEMVATESIENGIRFEGTDGWIFVSRERFESFPGNLINTRIGPNEIHLEESPGHLENFFACMRSGQQPIVTAEKGHRSATVCHIGNISMRLGRPLQWDPAKEEFINDPEANRMLSTTQRAPWNLL